LILSTTVMSASVRVRRAFGKRRKQLHFSDKQRRCDKCNTFLSKDNHQFCGTCINTGSTG
jgi:uncharacterized paraquat-inducible protein A